MIDQMPLQLASVKAKLRISVNDTKRIRCGSKFSLGLKTSGRKNEQELPR